MSRKLFRKGVYHTIKDLIIPLARGKNPFSTLEMSSYLSQPGSKKRKFNVSKPKLVAAQAEKDGDASHLVVNTISRLPKRPVPREYREQVKGKKFKHLLEETRVLAIYDCPANQAKYTDLYTVYPVNVKEFWKNLIEEQNIYSFNTAQFDSGTVAYIDTMKVKQVMINTGNAPVHCEILQCEVRPRAAAIVTSAAATLELDPQMPNYAAYGYEVSAATPTLNTGTYPEMAVTDEDFRWYMHKEFVHHYAVKKERKFTVPAGGYVIFKHTFVFKGAYSYKELSDAGIALAAGWPSIVMRMRGDYAIGGAVGNFGEVVTLPCKFSCRNTATVVGCSLTTTAKNSEVSVWGKILDPEVKSVNGHMWKDDIDAAQIGDVDV